MDTNGSDGKKSKINDQLRSDFRQIPVCPTIDELQDQNQPAIEFNIIKGKYNSVDHYLDIHYRLLREDFVRPLRRGINQYLDSVKSMKSSERRPKIQDIEVYENVKIEKLCEKSVSSYWALFDTKHLNHIDWKNSERLFFGSLVCLSSDNFQTIRFASITGNRTEDNLMKGVFQLKIETQLLAKGLSLADRLSDMCSPTDLFSNTYVMIESKAYFEAYRHTLRALQKFNSNNFPLKQYIIDVNNDVSNPSYLTSKTTYDLSHLIVSPIPEPVSDEEVMIIEDRLPSNSDKYKNVKIMDSNQWPNAETIGLDETQYLAFKTALLKQLVLIQGPPGTGKTFVGLKIVETLYVNRFVNRYHKSKPILIVCYTNHALDQFLEGILSFCTSLIRIGGGSKSEIIKKYTLRHGRRDEKRIKNKDIIGMTTTGAAKFREILESIDPKIVIIEEAAEVLESHVITSLTKNTEHLILIGDHKQLRPQTADYGLTKRYNLNISLFERFINNGMPFNQLKLQHRMRPEISGLLTPHIYEFLFDHKSVFEYQDIRGINKNMFFLNHSQLESSTDQRMSKTNRFEAQFVVRLAKHLLYQNYESSKITILTLYSSQYFLIKNLLKENPFYDGINCEVLDGFQGEENDIILVSFVRSNDNNDIGFLKISNRINVALSRAKKGLYCIGNFDCLSKRCDLWDSICNYLIEIKAIGPSIQLYCPKHTNRVISVAKLEDFDKIPFGGCSEPCLEALECGHSCPFKTCHPLSHKQIKCEEKCFKTLDCIQRHKCLRFCHFPDKCKPCIKKIEKSMPGCGHRLVDMCSAQLFCSIPCERGLLCGHRCHNKCGQSCQLICTEKVEKMIEECGHKVIVECFTTQFICGKPCEKWLLCGHRCKGKCFEECELNCDQCSTLLNQRNSEMHSSAVEIWIDE